MTILRRIAYLRLAELWSLPHLSGEASPTSPIGSLWSHGTTRTANTPHGRVRSFEKAALLALPSQVFGGCAASSGLGSPCSGVRPSP